MTWAEGAGEMQEGGGGVAAGQGTSISNVANHLLSRKYVQGTCHQRVGCREIPLCTGVGEGEKRGGCRKDKERAKERRRSYVGRKRCQMDVEKTEFV